MKKGILLMLLLAIAVNTMATYGDTAKTAILLNNDTVFSGDLEHTEGLRSVLSAKGFYTMNKELPQAVYGFNSNLTNSYTLFSSSHGVEGGGILVLANNNLYTANDIPSSAGLQEFTYLSACYSLKTSDVYGNLGTALLNAGVEVVVGYTDSVRVTESRYFEEQFYLEAVTNGRNIVTALSLAKSRTTSAYGSNTTSNSSTMLGNGSYVIQP